MSAAIGQNIAHRTNVAATLGPNLRLSMQPSPKPLGLLDIPSKILICLFGQCNGSHPMTRWSP